jgi:CBS domain-containing protein
MFQPEAIASGSPCVDELGTVEAAMTRTVVSVPSDMSAIEALAYLYRHGVGGAPVVDHDRVEGVVTISDLAAPRPYARETGPFHRPHDGGPEWKVGDVMTQSAVTASPGEPLIEAVVRMARARVDRLPVVDRDGRPVGIVARDDVVRVLSRVATRKEALIETRRPVLVPD